MARQGHGARVLRNSKIFEDGQAGRLFQLEGSSRITPERIGTCDVNICLIGDPAYPLLPCITKAYPVHVVTTPTQRRFNYRLSRARMSIENAFGRLKGRNGRRITLLQISFFAFAPRQKPIATTVQCNQKQRGVPTNQS